MRWVVTGAAGMLGVDVVESLRLAGHDVVGLGSADLDVRQAAACDDALRDVDVVVNCAAWTDVDAAEAHEAEAFAVNAVGAANVARACRAHGAVMIQISTDYVFSGDADDPYDIDAPLRPVNAYGRTKAAGEWAVRAECPRSHVVRTAWLYGRHGHSFVGTMLRLAEQRETVDVVTDQRGQPTWTRDLADFLPTLVDSPAPFGVHHGCASGDTTWFGLAQEIFRLRGHDPARVRPSRGGELVRPAPRPAFSVLRHDGRLPDWHDGLVRALGSWASP